MEDKIKKILEEYKVYGVKQDLITEELLVLFNVSQQRELLIGALEEYNKVKYEWTKLTYEDYVNKYHPNL